MNPTLGAVVITRNDGYGGDQPRKLLYCLTSLLQAVDEVILVDWNSTSPLLPQIQDELRLAAPARCPLLHIIISPVEARSLVATAQKHAHPTAQNCVEVLARNIGLRRLTTNYLISVNHDIVCLDRESILNGMVDDPSPAMMPVFHTVARREVHLDDVPRIFAHPPGSPALRAFLRAHSHAFQGHHHVGGVPSNFGQHADGSPLGPRDPWSLITCPGDFQLAHRTLWHRIRGFEEEMIGRGYNDSNVQRKAVEAGFGLRLVREIPVFHFCHYPATGSQGGGVGEWNDPDRALFQFKSTTNGEDWGFARRTFNETIL